MALASLLAMISMLIATLLDRHLQRDFAHEWSDRLRVKHPEPLGEDEIARLRQEQL